MGIRVEHELHRRRLSRNVGLGLVLLVFAGLVFGLTLVKTKRGFVGLDREIEQSAPAQTAPAQGGN